ncbi:MAG: GNAT family N-acetyltransferase [Clostridia bacterium]|nr:GNAT family N-acetyltransferase [Clostridia bacterium]
MCIISKAKAKDADELIEYFKKVGGETDNLSFGSEGLPFTVQEEAEYLLHLENSKDGIMLLAKDNGKIVGNASLSRFPRRMSHRGEISVTVLKDYWNRGIGGQLLGKIIEFAKANAFDIIDLQVRNDNLSAIHLYEKFGFKTIGTHPSFFKDIPFDYMYLEL